VGPLRCFPFLCFPLCRFPPGPGARLEYHLRELNPKLRQGGRGSWGVGPPFRRATIPTVRHSESTLRVRIRVRVTLAAPFRMAALKMVDPNQSVNEVSNAERYICIINFNGNGDLGNGERGSHDSQQYMHISSLSAHYHRKNSSNDNVLQPAGIFILNCAALLDEV